MTRIRHSVCKWCYGSTPLEDLCIAAKDIGIESIELCMPDELPLLEKHGLTCAMVSFPTGKTPTGITVGTIEKAFNRIEHHDTLMAIYEPHLQAAAAGGAKNVIVFSGNREGMSDEQGLENCAIGLQRLLPLAEKLGITLVMELLNSKVNHPDYMCDHTAWGVALSERLDSKNFGLLYDIYHMQIMEGDIIRTIRENHRHFTHYHTGGCPGRNEIDDTQELFYPAIMKAIVETGYQGHVGQEFIPLDTDPIASLRRAVEICTV
jgi:hydroxypyruvate isomerase